MTNLTNSDRINNWRKKTIKGYNFSIDSMNEKIPTKREEDLESTNFIKSDILHGKLPNEDDLNKYITDIRKKRWQNNINIYNIFFRIALAYVSMVIGYGAFIMPPSVSVSSSLVIIHGNQQNNANQLNGLTGISNSEGLADAYRMREYLKSPEAMIMMEHKYGFLTHFRKGTMDPFSRPIQLDLFGLDDYYFYNRKIDIAIDIREGIIRLEVEALTSEDSKRFSNGLIELARDRTKHVSDLINNDQSNSFKENVREAQLEVQRAATELALTQQNRHEFDPQAAATAVYQLITDLQTSLIGKQSQRDSLIDSGILESPLLERLDAEIIALNKQISQQQSRLTGRGVQSLANTASALTLVSSRLRLAQMSFESSLRTLEQANLSNISQGRYLIVIAAPALPYITWKTSLIKITLLTLLASVLIFGAGIIIRAYFFLSPTNQSTKY